MRDEFVEQIVDFVVKSIGKKSELINRNTIERRSFEDLKAGRRISGKRETSRFCYRSPIQFRHFQFSLNIRRSRSIGE